MSGTFVWSPVDETIDETLMVWRVSTPNETIPWCNESLSDMSDGRLWWACCYKWAILLPSRHLLAVT